MMGLGIDTPKAYMEVEDVARAVQHSLGLAKQFSTFSSQNLNLRHYDWTPASRDESLLGAPDIAVPAWVERQADDSIDYWQFVPTCNLATLEEARMRGEFRCAFYVENAQLRIKFSYPWALATPTYTQHRLWYDPNPLDVETFNDLALDAQATALPANLAPMISGMAELEMLSTMMIRGAMANPPASKELIAAWGHREQYLTGKVALWKDRFNHFVFGSRGARRGFRRRSILARTRSIY